MASVFAKAAHNAGSSERRAIAHFTTDLHEHAFTKPVLDEKGQPKLDARGRPLKEPTGEVGYAFRIVPTDAAGKATGMTMWIWLDGPEALAQFIHDVPAIYASAKEAYAIGVEGMGWPALAKPAAKPEPKAKAEPAKPASPFAKAAKSESAAAKEAAIADGLEDMPF